VSVVVRDTETPSPDLTSEQARPWRARLASWSWAEVLTALAVLFGIALRMRQYQFRRSLWTDEAMLTLNIIRRGYVGLTKPLDLLQGAPIGFLWVQRASVDVFGNNELALRLFPLVAGVASVVLFALLVRRLLTPWAALVAVLLFATVEPLVYYSSEAKQYSVDVAASLLVVLGALRLLDRPFTLRRMLLFGVFGAGIVLFSHPATMVVACALCVVGIMALRRRDWRSLAGLALGASVWGGTFLAQYLRSLRPVAGNETLQGFWAPGYPPKPFRLGSALRWVPRAITELVPNPVAVGHRGVLLVLVLVGVVVLLRRRRPAAALFVLLAAAALTAATLRLYPLRWRLALSLVPFVLLTAVASFDVAMLVRRGRVALRAGAVALIALVGWTPVHQAFREARHPVTVTEMRPLLEHVARRLAPGDAIYVHWSGAAEFEYYQAVLHLPRYAQLRYDTAPQPCDDGRALADVGHHTRAWVVLGAPPIYDPEDNNALTLARFDLLGRRIEDRTAPGKAEVALYDELRPPPPGQAPVPHPGQCLRLHPK
jgi:hypothetical protein